VVSEEEGVKQSLALGPVIARTREEEIADEIVRLYYGEPIAPALAAELCKRAYRAGLADAERRKR
jgi:hypothetical protein